MNKSVIHTTRTMSKLHLKIFRKRPISPSCLTSWFDEFGKDHGHKKWAEHYLLGKKVILDDLSEARMAYGTAIHERIATDPAFLPSVPRYDSFEDTINVSYGSIPLTGKVDTLRVDLTAFADYKTTQSKTYWTQAAANKHIQFLFYFLLLYLKYDIQPSEVTCKVVVIHIDEEQTGDFKTIRKLSNRDCEIFTVKHSMLDIINFLILLKDTHKSMCDFAKQYK